MGTSIWEWLLIAIIVFAIFNANKWPETKRMLEKYFQVAQQKAKESKQALEKKLAETKENMAQKNEAAKKAKEEKAKQDSETTENLD